MEATACGLIGLGVGGIIGALTVAMFNGQSHDKGYRNGYRQGYDQAVCENAASNSAKNQTIATLQTANVDLMQQRNTLCRRLYRQGLQIRELTGAEEEKQ